MLERVCRKGNPPTRLVGMQVGATTMKNSMEFPQKTKRAAIWSSNPIPGHIPRQNYNQKRHLQPCVHCNTVHRSQDVETIWMSIDRWTDKDVVGARVHTHTRTDTCTHRHIHTQTHTYIYICIYIMEYYLAFKKNEMPFAATWMDLEITI